MRASTLNNVLQTTEEEAYLLQEHQPLHKEDARTRSNLIKNAVIQESIGGVLIFSDQNRLIYACDTSQKILNQLRSDDSASHPFIPGEINHICHSLMQSRLLFPDQNWLIECDIFTRSAMAIHVRARWLTTQQLDHSYLILNIEDRQQAITNIVLQEADRYGLTPREKDVWVLQHDNYTYKQIAAELGITSNTVKKHVRSIYAKKKKAS
ncbi:MAG: helix-turn-helix transcriptional regulator [Leptolyngbyaceae bacterium]|nr:helix-turn-helix transcriptional regulator [Leptolyngbyaceae bacterium]